MFVLVSYDVVDDKRRTRIAKCLKLFGDRVQFSVFECNMEQAEMDKMLAKLRKLVDEKEDSMRIYINCANCTKRLTIIGLGGVTQDPDLIVV